MPKEPQFDFRVIAGELKGKKIVSPDLGITRPPLSRVRKAIFDYLTPYLDGAAYLDLFSGTGSYLFEAVSRGAKTGTGVEHDSRLADAINAQVVAQPLFMALPGRVKAYRSLHSFSLAWLSVRY